jgi:hypothetical protein
MSVWTLPAGTYNIYAVATDSATPASTNSLTNTFYVADPIAFALTAPTDGATVDNLTPVTGKATLSGGTAPYSVQFFFDDLPSGAPVISFPYEHDFGALPVGDHYHPRRRHGCQWLGEQFARFNCSRHRPAGGDADSNEWHFLQFRTAVDSQSHPRRRRETVCSHVLCERSTGGPARFAAFR